MHKNMMVVGFCASVMVGALQAQGMSLLGVATPAQAAPVVPADTRAVTEAPFRAQLELLRTAIESGSVEASMSADLLLAQTVRHLHSTPERDAAFAARMQLAYDRMRHTFRAMQPDARNHALDLLQAAANLSLGGVRLFWPDRPATRVSDTVDVDRAIGLLPPDLREAMSRAARTNFSATPSATVTGATPEEIERAGASLPAMVAEARELIARGDTEAFRALSTNFTARFDAFVVLVARQMRAEQAAAEEVFRRDVADISKSFPVLIPGSALERDVARYRALRERGVAAELLAAAPGVPSDPRYEIERVRALLCRELAERFANAAGPR